MEQDGKGTTKERKRGWENEQPSPPKKKPKEQKRRWKGGKTGREERREEECKEGITHQREFPIWLWAMTHLLFQNNVLSA